VGCVKETCVCRKGCGLSPIVDSIEVEHGKENGCDCIKGFGLSPKEDKSGLGCGKEHGCSLTPPVDESGVGYSKVDLCGGRLFQFSPSFIMKY
jgi:hypothetical protein